MPTVLRVDGFAFSFFPGDHEPPHVHVRYSGGQLVMVIESERVRNVRSMSEADIGKTRMLVRLHRAALLKAWAEWHPAKDQ